MIIYDTGGATLGETRFFAWGGVFFGLFGFTHAQSRNFAGKKGNSQQKAVDL